jgi:hypothetical protein
LGLSVPYDRSGDDQSIGGSGVLGGAEYILKSNEWLSPRAYAALLFTFSEQTERCRDQRMACDVSAKLGLLGVKARVTFPIPYVAPFLEVGIGLSLGAMRTRTLKIREKLEGATYHVPVAIGLSLGESRSVDVAFQYWAHPAAKQLNGGLLVGLTFAIDDRASI